MHAAGSLALNSRPGALLVAGRLHTGSTLHAGRVFARTRQSQCQQGEATLADWMTVHSGKAVVGWLIALVVPWFAQKVAVARLAAFGSCKKSRGLQCGLVPLACMLTHATHL